MSHQTFFATAAQVIPVLWIVNVFQLGTFGDEPGRGVGQRGKELSSGVLFYIGLQAPLSFAAEILCLSGILDGTDGDVARGIVFGALLSGTTALFLTPAFPIAEELANRARARWRERRDNLKE